MYCKRCDCQVANEKLPQCPRCKRQLTRHEQSYRGLLFHDLRRTAARRLRNSGLSEQMIMRIGGWKTTSVFHRYAIVNRQEMGDAMRKFEQHQRQLAAENGHSLDIVAPSAVQTTPARKLQ